MHNRHSFHTQVNYTRYDRRLNRLVPEILTTYANGQKLRNARRVVVPKNARALQVRRIFSAYHTFTFAVACNLRRCFKVRTKRKTSRILDLNCASPCRLKLRNLALHPRHFPFITTKFWDLYDYSPRHKKWPLTVANLAAVSPHWFIK